MVLASGLGQGSVIRMGQPLLSIAGKER
jgi:hypothetical protein